jgi:cold shock CspA family protein
MEKGIIVFFDPNKGFGKIKSSSGLDFFVGIEDLRDQVTAGSKVSFEIAVIGNISKAIKVKLYK